MVNFGTFFQDAADDAEPLQMIDAIADLMLVCHQRRKPALKGDADLHFGEAARPAAHNAIDGACDATALEYELRDGMQARFFPFIHGKPCFIYCGR